MKVLRAPAPVLVVVAVDLVVVLDLLVVSDEEDERVDEREIVVGRVVLRIVVDRVVVTTVVEERVVGMLDEAEGLMLLPGHDPGRH